MQFLADNWWVTAIIALIAAGAVYKIFFAGKDRKHQCVVVTEDNRIVKMPIPLRLGHLVLDKDMEAYAYCPEILCYDGGSNDLVAVFDERDPFPIPISGKAEDKRSHYKEKLQSIAQSCHDRALMKTERKNMKNKLVSMLSFVLGAFAIVTLLVILAGIYIVNKG